MLTLGMVVIGVISFFRLPQELFPPINFPQITIITEYANAAPEEIETLITRPIEETISSVAGLKRIESTSREGRSMITISFNWGLDVDFAALAVREKIDIVKERLPKESEDPVVLKYDPLARPIMLMSVTGDNLPPIQLKLLAEKIIKDNLEKVEGVASATVSGGATRQIYVDVDQGRLQANHLSLLEVIDAIEHSNVTYPAGSIKKGLFEYLIRTVGDFRTLKDIEYTVVGSDTVKKMRGEETSFVEKGSRGPRSSIDSLREEVKKELLEKRLVLVRDIAEVIDGVGEKTSVSRHNGSENISIAIQKQANANTIQVVDRVKKELEFLADDISNRGLHYDIIYDHSIFIRKSLEDLAGDAESGGFLAFLVLLFALKSFLPALIVTLSIPLTVIGTFFLMSATGITLNTMSLGGLALGSGMIVDTSIVVLENIFRRRESGEEAYAAAINGTSEVVWPVITSNATTIAVFLPLIIFVPGIPGQLFRDLSWAIIHSQIISTIVPLTVIPMVSVYLKVKKQEEAKDINWTGFLEKRLMGEKVTINQRIRFASFMLLIVFAVCWGTSALILPTLEKEVLPKVDQGQFLVKVDMPLGTRLEVTDRVCDRIEKLLKGVPEVKDIAVTIGSEKGGKGQIKVDTLRASQAIILVTLNKERKRPSADIVRELQVSSRDINLESAQADFVMQESEFAFAEGGSKPVLIEVKGYEFKSMIELVEQVKRNLLDIPGVFNTQDDMGKTSPETRLNINKKKAALYGISALDISLIVKAALAGVVPTQFRETGKEYDILVRLSQKDRENISNLGGLLLYSKVLDALIPLKEMAEIEQSASPSEIKRLDQERTIIVSAEIEKEHTSSEILPQVQVMLQNMNIAPQSGMQVGLSGKAKEIKESFSKVIFAFVLAFSLVYMIMAAQFESFAQPAMIMITVPLAFFGVTIALVATHTTINVISALGVIILVGTVVNNGIMLVEYTNQLRQEGKDIEDAAITATKVRTRPILMSALTSVIGLVPLALGLGEGAELRAPMAVTMMGGQLSSTFLTLVVLPCFYIVIARLSEKIFGVAEPEEETTTPGEEEATS